MTDAEVREIVSRYPEKVAAFGAELCRAWSEVCAGIGRAVDLMSEMIREHPELFPLVRLPQVADEPLLTGPHAPHASD